MTSRVNTAPPSRVVQLPTHLSRVPPRRWSPSSRKSQCSLRAYSARASSPTKTKATSPFTVRPPLLLLLRSRRPPLCADHIHNRILPSTPSDADCPPLHVLAYVVRASILPTVVLGQMPRTLTQLAQIEHIRRLFAQRLDEILEADKKLRHDPDPMVMPLRSDWRIELKQMRNSVGRRLRRTFREIVNGFSLYVRPYTLHSCENC